MSPTFDQAVAFLKNVHARALRDDEAVQDIADILAAEETVLSRFQPLFTPARAMNITEDEFRSFLFFRNNQHWMGLQRMGPRICQDMDRLREALQILLNESRPVRDRLNDLVPGSRSSLVPGLHKAVLTPILMVAHPMKYGVWNRVSESAMTALGLWPQFERGLPFGDRYERVNSVLVEVARAVGVNLWVLDALWWRAEALVEDDSEDPHLGEGAHDPDEPLARFGLERHLQEFMRDNWDHLDLAQSWALHEEDGDPEAGYEYPCDVGRIDLLARHRDDGRWLVIELKRNQSSDQTVGQVLRYMGWVKKHLAAEPESVEGLVVAHYADTGIRYALEAVEGITLKLYEVEFRLRTP